MYEFFIRNCLSFKFYYIERHAMFIVALGKCAIMIDNDNYHLIAAILSLFYCSVTASPRKRNF